VSDYYLKVVGSTNVLEGSTTGFIQTDQCDNGEQQFDIVPGGSGFTTIPCGGGGYWKYTNSVGVKLVSTPMGNNAKFKVQKNGDDYQIYCKGVNGGNTPLTIAGADKFDLDPV